MELEHNEFRRVSVLERISIEAIDGDPSVTGRSMLEMLANNRALIIKVPGYGGLHQRSIDLARWFFNQPYEAKATADGCRFFSEKFRDADIQFEFAGESYRRMTADVYGKERGWTPLGKSNSAVRNEMFQYGCEKLPSGRDEPALQNVWPTCANADRFVSAKRALMDRMESLHRSLFSVISAGLFGGCTTRLCSEDVNIFCRDTHYFPKPQAMPSCEAQESIWVRNNAHVDLGETTLIKVEPGLQLYTGRATEYEYIINDSKGWCEIEASAFEQDDLLLITGLALEIRLGGAVPAVWHRVVGTTSKESADSRYSIVSFGNAGSNDLLTPLVPGRREYIPIHRNHLPLVGNRGYVAALTKTNGSAASCA